MQEMSSGLSTGGMVPGVLRVHPLNPRYFTDGSGRAIYLTGSHTWANLHERAYDETPSFDYLAYLDFMTRFEHNCMRLWAWEHAAWMQFTDRKIVYTPNRYRRTGPGTALDGNPKFDVTQFDETFFRRLRDRVVLAGERGIYVLVMLFQGFSVGQKGTEGIDPCRGNAWDGHPFHASNNVNGINADLNGDGEGYEVHTLADPRITRLQQAYVRKVVGTLNDLDNVLWEISNESRGDSSAWQYHMIDLLHNYERDKPKQHPVVMTFQWGGRRSGTNGNLFVSPAEAVSPNPKGGYRDDPPAADGSKVILNDTDHLWGIGGNAGWVWKCFLRGQNPIFMDPYLDARTGGTYDPQWDPIRRAMGDTLRYAERMDLAAMAPRGDLASTGYCLAQAGSASRGAEYLVYLPDGGRATVDLSAVAGGLAVEWFDPGTGRVVRGRRSPGGAVCAFEAPFAGDAVLYLCSA